MIRGIHARQWVMFLPALALASISALQVAVAHYGYVTPWKGGGFGMFAVTDAGINRVLVAMGTTSTGEVVPLVLRTPDDRQLLEGRLARRLHTSPSQRMLRQTGELLLELPWSTMSRTDGRVVGFVAPQGGRLTAVDLTIFRIAFDPASNIARRIPLLHIRVAR